MIGFIVGTLVGGCIGFFVCVILTQTNENAFWVKEVNMFDDEHIFHDCTVQVLDRKDGEPSIGWWRNDKPPVKLKRKEK